MITSNDAPSSPMLKSATGKLVPTDARPNFFLAGFQKCATTWAWQCLREHPQVFVPPIDGVHYFTTQHHRGQEWYLDHFSSCSTEKVIGDTTPQYARHPLARERMFTFNPDAKVLLIVRNPIERAYSHYKHERRRGVTTRPFSDAVGNNIDVFEAWIGSGFYDVHLRGLLDFYPRERICVLLYDDLGHDPSGFCRQMFEFLDVDPSFTPAVLHCRVNAARSASWLRFPWRKLSKSLSPPGIDPRLREELRSVFRPHNEWLSEFLGRDLTVWT